MLAGKSAGDVQQGGRFPEFSGGVAAAVSTGRIHRADSGKANLAAMRMAREHQMHTIATCIREMVGSVADQDSKRVQRNALPQGLYSEPGSFIAGHRDLLSADPKTDALASQILPAASREELADLIDRQSLELQVPIVISQDKPTAVRRFQLAESLGNPIEALGMFEQVAAEDNQIRGRFFDLCNDTIEILPPHGGLKMPIREMPN